MLVLEINVAGKYVPAVVKTPLYSCQYPSLGSWLIINQKT